MRIKSINAYKLFIKLPQPLTISFHTFDYTEAFLVRIESSDGVYGWGEGAPFKLITGDSYEDVVNELASIKRLIGCEFETPEEFYDQQLSSVACCSLRAALDFAAHDLMARYRDVPVHALYQRQVRMVPNCVTVFIQDSARSTATEAKRILTKYPDLKLLKIKLKGTDDFERCLAIKRIERPGLKYVLDANQGFIDPELAVIELAAIVDLLGDVIMIEEPCLKGDLKKAQIVTAGVRHSLIVADESCCGEFDLDAIIAAKAFGGINIKLQKAGGITSAKRLARKAQQAGMKVMVGQMFESPLSTAAGVHFAVSTENVVLTDLDMDLELPDFSTGQCEFRAGQRVPLSAVGFGFELQQAKIQRLVASGQLQFKQIL